MPRKSAARWSLGREPPVVIRNGLFQILPPARPVVSVSRKSHCLGSEISSGASGINNLKARSSGEYRGGWAHQAAQGRIVAVLIRPWSGSMARMRFSMG